MVKRSSWAFIEYLGFPVLTYRIENGKRVFSVYHRRRPENNQRVFYLKINRDHPTSFDCIQHWMDVIEKLGGFIYFVCDDQDMKEGLFKKPCFFHSNNFEFIKSDSRYLKKEIFEILKNTDKQRLWMRIAHSMMTPFVHAQKHKFNNIYNIDADDIAILIRPDLLAKAFIQMEGVAEKKLVDCLNFDMFVSKTFGVHWSFGVVYVRNPENCLAIFKKNIDWRFNDKLIAKFNVQYIEKYNFNVDWYFTYLRDTNQLKLDTFYIENAVVVHMPDRLLLPWWAFVLVWSENRVELPILENLYNVEGWYSFPVAKHIHKIDIGLSLDEAKKFLNEFYHSDFSFEKDILDIALQRNLISVEQAELYMLKK